MYHRSVSCILVTVAIVLLSPYVQASDGLDAAPEVRATSLDVLTVSVIPAEQDEALKEDKTNLHRNPNLLSPGRKLGSTIAERKALFEKAPEICAETPLNSRGQRATIPETSEMLASYSVDSMARVIESKIIASLYETSDMLDSASLSPFANHIEALMDASFYVPKSPSDSTVCSTNMEEEPADGH